METSAAYLFPGEQNGSNISFLFRAAVQDILKLPATVAVKI
jgi:hypothetical protein